METSYRYINGPESIFYFYRVEKITLIGSFVNQLKNNPPEVNMHSNSWQRWCTKNLYTKVPKLNLPATEMFFAEAPVVPYELRQNQ